MRCRHVAALLAVATLTTTAAACGGDDGTAIPKRTTTTLPSAEPPTKLTLAVTAQHPHDPAAFTEGLTFADDGRLFESIGLEGASAIREVDPETGAVVEESKLPATEFGEGIAIRGDEITQLTWKSGVVHRWSLDTLHPSGQGEFSGEGWGLTYDGKRFIQSDGSSKLTFRDPSAFDPPTGTIEVRRAGKPVDQINELEYVDGSVWANVWHSDEILRIDPKTGRVTGVVDASTLWKDAARTSEMTLNGIAHKPGDPATHLWLTGKNWPSMFEVDVR